MSWFSELSSPETITAIAGGIGTIIAAIGVIIAKYKLSKKIDFEGCAEIFRKADNLIKYIKRPLKKDDKSKLKSK